MPNATIWANFFTDAKLVFNTPQMRRAICMGLLCLLTDMAAAADYRVDAQDYRDYLRRLQPGDRVLLAPGDYHQGLPLHNLSGQAGQPIIIEAADPAAPPRFIARPGANTVSLVNALHVLVIVVLAFIQWPHFRARRQHNPIAHESD
jgi:hypothetical protein